MRLRLVLLSAAAIGLVAASTSPASAAKKKPKAPVKKAVCWQMPDRSGDGAFRATGNPKSPAVDILDGSVATGAKTVVGVLKVATTDFSSDPQAYTGFSWTLKFKIKGVVHAFKLWDGLGPLNSRSSEFTVASAKVATPTVKIGADTIRWEVPRSVVPALKKANMVMVELGGGTNVGIGGADAVETQTTYIDKWPSCHKPK